MAYSDSFPAPGAADGPRGDWLQPVFTGMPQDHVGPVERCTEGPGLPFLLSKATQAPAPREDSSGQASKAPEGAAAEGDRMSQSLDGSDIFPLEEALELQTLLAGLVLPTHGIGEPHMTTLPSAPGLSLAALAEELNARFTTPVEAPSGAVDLLAIQGNAAVWEAVPAAAAKGVEEALAVGSPPAPLSVIRAAVGALSNPPKLPVLSSAAPPPPFFPGETLFEKEAPAGAVDQMESTAIHSSQPDTLDLMQEAEVPGWIGEWGETAATSDFIAVPADPALLRAETGTVARPEEQVPEAPRPSVGSVIGGAGLILLGIYLACQLPLLWLELGTAEGWTRSKTEAALLLYAAAALSSLVLGAGAVRQRPWAAPGIIAAGWLIVFTGALVLGVAGVRLGLEEAAAFNPVETGQLLAGMFLPLAYLLYFEKTHPETNGNKHRPPPRPIPGLIILLGGIVLALTGAAMLRFPPALPLPPSGILTGPAAELFWAVLLVVGLLTAFCAWHRRAAAWGLLFLGTFAVTLTIGICGCIGGPFWARFLAALGAPDGGAAATPFLPLLAGLSPSVLWLLLAMARRAFPSPPPP